ncbi:helix-turn-helix domain-containing protein [Caproiciproducens sp.]
MNLDVLGHKIQALREEKKLSQEQLANLVGCSQSAISNYEKGKRHIYLDHLEKLSDIFDTPISALMEGEDKSENSSAQASSNGNQILEIIQKLYTLDNCELNELDSFIKYLIWKRSKGGAYDEF